MVTVPAMPAEQTARPMGSLTDAYLGWDETDPQAILYDARNVKRATAINRHANEYGCAFRDVQCMTRYARWLTRDEQWEAVGRDRYGDDQLDAYFTGDGLDPCFVDGAWRRPDGQAIELAPAPDDPPADWQPRDDDPTWEFCGRGDEGAIRVYVCEVDR